MKGAPRSEQFDDIYFSAEDGLAETQHVFLEGNNLPAAWEGQDNFVVAETGFGTGLNFLSVWKLFEETTKSNQTLDFISVEKFPLTSEQIKEALEPWADFLGKRIDILCNQYPMRVGGFHRVKINSQITLTLIFGDINETFPEIDAQIDCWFLDGFTPAKNPDMWSNTVFQEMARLSKSGASYSTFTAAGDVRRGLESVGFSVQKTRGFGRKRDMISGVYDMGRLANKTSAKKPKTVAIIGGGLAGTSCAYVLKQYGFIPVIYEASDQLAGGASGNSCGFYNPRFSALNDFSSNYFAPAYCQFYKMAREAGDAIEFDPCGALYLATTDDKKNQFLSMLGSWEWNEDCARFLSAEEASKVAGIKISKEALFFPYSGSVNPRKLCTYYTKDIEVHLNQKIQTVDELQEDAVILCNAYAIEDFQKFNSFPVVKVRGQISHVQAVPETEKLRCNIHYSGYFSRSRNGQHAVGATFQKWIDEANITSQDHDFNIESLKEALSVFEDHDFDVLSGWAGLRTASKDHFPIVGRMEENNYVSIAYGSHGLVGSLASAHLLADFLRKGPKSLPKSTLNALKPQRFAERALKKEIKS